VNDWEMIFFDIDGTLIDHASASAAASLNFYDHFAERIAFTRQDFPTIWERILMIHFQRFTRGETSLWEQRRGRMREVFQDPGLSDVDCDSRYRVFMEHYEVRCEAYADAEPCLQRLHGKDLGIISNGGREQQVGKLRRSGLLKYFSVLMFSEDVGVGKPASGIFLEACRQAGEKPAACAHAGDDLVADVAPSRALGMQAVWLDRLGLGDGQISAPRISTLNHLESVLSGGLRTKQVAEV
jgi:putative hydrolase of the HAD superfamily